MNTGSASSRSSKSNNSPGPCRLPSWPFSAGRCKPLGLSLWKGSPGPCLSPLSGWPTSRPPELLAASSAVPALPPCPRCPPLPLEAAVASCPAALSRPVASSPSSPAFAPSASCTPLSSSTCAALWACPRAEEFNGTRCQTLPSLQMSRPPSAALTSKLSAPTVTQQVVLLVATRSTAPSGPWMHPPSMTMAMPSSSNHSPVNAEPRAPGVPCPRALPALRYSSASLPSATCSPSTPPCMPCAASPSTKLSLVEVSYRHHATEAGALAKWWCIRGPHWQL
mmetsp:Transcript_51732/g.160223  ORF Transcript_51732/g.160223 Transcript_51732/m.160223 type:complete len:280 (+) Transcript_51732:799-1638(+)